MEEIEVGLCKGRHEMPVENYIFTEEINPTDFRTMAKVVNSWLSNNCGIHICMACAVNQADDTSIDCFVGGKRVVLYVTGLSAALAEVIKACALNGVELTLMHYDRESGQYTPQKIF